MECWESTSRGFRCDKFPTEVKPPSAKNIEYVEVTHARFGSSNRSAGNCGLKLNVRQTFNTAESNFKCCALLSYRRGSGAR